MDRHEYDITKIVEHLDREWNIMVIALIKQVNIFYAVAYAHDEKHEESYE